MKSISDTKFFRLLKRDGKRRTFWGKLSNQLVESEKPVIVFDSRGILMASDSVEEATTFFTKEKGTGRFVGHIYQHEGREWKPIDVDFKSEG